MVNCVNKRGYSIMKSIIQLPINTVNKLFVQYPISYACPLGCYYCFNVDARQKEAQGLYDKYYTRERPFTFADYRAWRDRQFPGITDILMELHGGEMSHPDNQADALSIIDAADKERFQLQTNGLGPLQFYAALARRKDKIEQVGFTYHREVIGNDKMKQGRFLAAVMFLRGAGLKVYVKELLWPKHKAAMLDNKRYWEGRGVEFHIQEFRGVGGVDSSVMASYTAEDWMLISPEYLHGGSRCACREGYTNIIINGYGMFAGDVTACWYDPCVVGNICKGWYHPGYTINRSPHGNPDVVGVEKIYRGTYPGDKALPGIENYYPALTRDQLNYKEGFMGKWRVGEIDRLRNDIALINQTIDSKEAEIDRARRNIAYAQKTIDAAEAYITEIVKLREQDTGAIITLEKESQQEAAAVQAAAKSAAEAQGTATVPTSTEPINAVAAAAPVASANIMGSITPVASAAGVADQPKHAGL